MIWQAHEISVPLLLKGDPERSKSPAKAPITQTDHSENPDEQWYLCRNCEQPITRPVHRIAVQGSHTHTFANPSGMVFELACFSNAGGFSFMGPPSLEFTWFAGHSWRITICAGCLTHIGWFFSASGGQGFFGLIPDKLQLRDLKGAPP